MNKEMNFKQDKFNELRISYACDCADNILNFTFIGKIYNEDGEGNTSYTDKAQLAFDRIYDMVESAMLDFNMKVLEEGITFEELKDF